MSETNDTPETMIEEKELILSHQEAIDRQTLIDTGFATSLKQNSQGQPIEVQVNVIGLLAEIVRVFNRPAPTTQKDNTSE